MTDKKIEIKFAPGCFDGFEGTQEELDDLVAELQRLADSGELLDKAELVSEEDSEEIYRNLSGRKPQ